MSLLISLSLEIKYRTVYRVITLFILERIKSSIEQCTWRENHNATKSKQMCRIKSGRNYRVRNGKCCSDNLISSSTDQMEAQLSAYRSKKARERQANSGSYSLFKWFRRNKVGKSSAYSFSFKEVICAIEISDNTVNYI